MIRVDDVLDPDDPTLFPRLTEPQLERLARVSEEMSLGPGEVLFEDGAFVVRALHEALGRSAG